MAKSNRRRKLDRSKRQARASQKRAAAQRRQAAEETVRAVMERYDRLLDPDVPPAELIGLLHEHYEGGPVFGQLADLMLAHGSSPERLAEVAEAVLAAGSAGGGSPSLTALTFAAAVARVAGDAGKAHGLLGQALATADDPDDWVDIIENVCVSGRLADAIELLEARLREAPDDERAAECYGSAIEEAYLSVNQDQPPGACPCGRGASWRECCGPRERAALSRFTDRSGMIGLQDAVRAYLDTSGYGQAVGGLVAEALLLTDDLDWEPAERDAFGRLMAEHALLTAGLSASGEEAEDADDQLGSPEEDDADNPLAAFAADPSAPAEVAARAATWREHIHYGLWRIDGPGPAPGLWCTDITSGVTRYAEFPAGLSAAMPRWAVWLGGIVPVDGIWRSTGLGVRLSPAEGDAAAELLDEAATELVHHMAGKRKKKPSRPVTEPLRFGRAEPLGVYVDFEEPSPPYIAELLGQVTGALLPRIVAEVHEHRSAPPAIRNTDGEDAFPRGAAPPSAGWEKYWLDERVPALRGRTPRQAADGKERPLLEALLRQFEYEADLLAAEGESGVDTGWLRQELGMTYDPEN